MLTRNYKLQGYSLLFQYTHWYMEIHYSLSQDSTQRTPPRPSTSNWPTRDYHHGNSKWEELHSTDKHRGHCCPGNKPSYPRTTCACKLKYTSGASTLLSSYTLSLFYGATVNSSHHVHYISIQDFSIQLVIDTCTYTHTTGLAYWPACICTCYWGEPERAPH